MEISHWFLACPEQIPTPNNSVEKRRFPDVRASGDNDLDRIVGKEAGAK